MKLMKLQSPRPLCLFPCPIIRLNRPFTLTLLPTYTGAPRLSAHQAKPSMDENGSPSTTKPTMLKKVKAVKRRGVETIFQKIGVSDGTLDTEYEDCKRRFDRTIRELGELSLGMGSFLDKTRELYSSSQELADVGYEYYWGRLMMDWPPNTPSALRAHPVAAKFKQAWSHCNDVIRRSVGKVYVEQGLTPLRVFMTTIVPEIQHEVDMREAYVLDYDSYRRRYNALQDKHAKLSATAAANNNTGSNSRVQEVEKAMYQIQGKLNASEDRYRRQNTRVKEEMIKAKLVRDELLESAMRTMVACQVALFTKTGEHLTQLLSTLPEEEKVTHLQEQVEALIARGGPEVRVVEPSQMEKMVKTLANGFTPRSPASTTSTSPVALDASRSGGGGGSSSAAAAAPAPPKSPTKPVSTPGSTGQNSTSSGIFSNFFNRQSSGGDKASGATTTAAGDVGGGAVVSYAKIPSSGAEGVDAGVVTTTKPLLARALYDNEPEDESELGFLIGDVLEILNKDESGWWEARLNGKVGSIPANYVDLIA